MKKFYGIKPAAYYLIKLMFCVAFNSSTWPNESLAKDLLILLSTTPVHRCVHYSFKKGFICTVIGIVLWAIQYS